MKYSTEEVNRITDVLDSVLNNHQDDDSDASKGWYNGPIKPIIESMIQSEENGINRILSYMNDVEKKRVLARMSRGEKPNN